MTTFGFVLMAAGCLWVLLGALAEANHPTGGDSRTREFIYDGFAVAVFGIMLMLVGWLV